MTGSWTNSAAHTIDLGSQALNVGASVQMSDGTNGHTIDLTLSSGSFSVAGNLIQNGGANLNIGTSGILQVAGDFIYQSGAFTSGSGTVIYNGASAQNVAGGITYNN